MSWNSPPNGRHPHQKEWEKTTEDKEQHPGRSNSPSQTESQLHYSEHHVNPIHPHQSQAQHPLPPHSHHSQHHHPHPHPPPPAQTPHLPPIQQERLAIEQPEMYAASEPPYPYRIPPHQLPGFQQPANFQQPAPRQRTAIACRYCRRRKIRCSGFESSPDGRCANCLRFNQECVFTPVSSQTQAFVPAHALYNTTRSVGGRAGPLYGAHGQPLSSGYIPMPSQAPAPSAQSPMESRAPQQYPRPPSPGVGSGRQPPPPPAQPPYGSYEELVTCEPERNRSQEPHPPLLPPPVPGNQPQPHHLQRRSSASEYQSHYARNDPPSPSSHLLHAQHAYSPPPVSGPPSSSFQASSYGQGPPLSAASNYYPPGPGASQQRTRSPVGFRPPDRSSGSPHPFHPPMQYPPPPRPTSSGPSPSSPNTHPIPSMQMANLIDPSQPHGQGRNQRTAADGDMLDRLMPRSGL
ncbi:unnamed protein product [Tuber melanosporum]|uniref:(Perigord truffle) hypothetical protein n=1 Tax=Tuber melanosporum (strain Mel28) TaxID=656061 RepID=D5GQ31_TUBMM|nr:uncharacterized protein GSTUM_00012177001 [Tuber melanosporum]CAZ86624.1 unnamed protein product [Tuber melanosporum]